MNTIVMSMDVLPPTLNDIIGAARKNKYASAALKSQWHKIIQPCAYSLEDLDDNVYLECVWFVKNKSRDPDNIVAALKYIMDTLVETGKLESDSLRNIKSPTFHHFVISDFDGFSIILRDEEAFRERLFDDLSQPPKEAFEFIQGNVQPKSSIKEHLPQRRRPRRRKQPFINKTRRGLNGHK